MSGHERDSIKVVLERLCAVYSSYSDTSEEAKQNFYRQQWLEHVVHTRQSTDLPAVPASILEAWNRARELGVNPNKSEADHIVSPAELQQREERDAPFFQLSRSILNNMYNFLRDNDLNLAIADRDGILLDVFGSSSSVQSSFAGRWTTGADWSESAMGNNAIGTAIYSRMPTVVSGYEHYCRCSRYWAAASAPIFDQADNLLGVIALCGPYQAIHTHTVGMIVTIAQMIQLQIQLYRQQKQFQSERQALINTMADGVLGVSHTGEIRYYNQSLKQMLMLKDDEQMIGKHVKTLLPQLDALLGYTDSVQTVPSSGRELALPGNGGNYTCTPLYLPSGGPGSADKLLLIRNTPQGSGAAPSLPPARRGSATGAMWTFDTMVGQNAKFLALKREAAMAARMDSNIFLLGESGTGKDVLAQAIHNESPRGDKPFIAVNCAALPKDLIMSELFGYAEGTFTGAKRGGKKGKFEAANGGTLFLDEIGDMPLDQQAVLLRVLEDSHFSRLGSNERIPLNVRIIAATNQDIYHAVEEGRFRKDLFYRLHVFVFCTIPLRERKDDYEPLSNSFLHKIAGKSGRGACTPLSEQLLEMLKRQDFPGNIREFQNCLERAYMLASPPDYVITPNLLFSDAANAPEKPRREETHQASAAEEQDIRQYMKKYQAALLMEHLKENNYNVAKTCAQLGISRTTFYRKLKEAGLEVPR